MAAALKSLIRLLQSTHRSFPFPISDERIGDVYYMHLASSDDSRWYRVIHYLATNLEHLSNAVSEERRIKLQALLLET